ncbi:MAG TPA: protein-S-isoprenylcysteine O-methyltransferase [Burkholderiaceae bacterium]|uniref:Protein-S-isoprenylcysteine O-methyltransferase n=1 Tax=Caldimonas aquatica TaxID=376175 RepID=A0ABY6MMV5_9BURK|nr:protein-S-isoprenylcysteine O-methyltransferase [Schlegelella aquatica]UZD53833.1 protein-S-isoprenylcysteine O-methyltransferase [Schlegelella aquatica]HWP17708.1 protein-S-isoprenylcysteine O-methyltransferase [Burkholderiaceae bacterium]
MKRLHLAAAPGRPNATAGVYGSRLRAWVPVVLFAIVIAAHVWQRGGAVRWPELVWAAASLLQTLIRWPHVEAGRRNRPVRSHVDRREQWLMFVVFMTLMALPLLHVALPWFARWNYALPAAAPVAGTLMMALSLWVFHRSHADLGRNWSPSLEVHAEHRLVTEGVYRWARHPMYASIWLFALAQPLLIQNWVAGACSVPGFALLYFLRVGREERLMRETFGREYEAYAERVGRLMPRWGGR